MLRNKISFYKRKLTNYFTAPHPNPILVFGNQKSGTTAISQLLGLASNLDVSNDPFYVCPDKQLSEPYLYRNKTRLSKFVKQNADLFSSPIIKDPEFCFFYKELIELYPNSRFVFVLRDPYQNVRSIFDRLGLNGDAVDLSSIDLKKNRVHWDWIQMLDGRLSGVKGKTIAETLALRWKFNHQLYQNNKARFTLASYEAFLNDKKPFIENLCKKLDLGIQNDISEQTGIAFQPSGKNAELDPKAFFSAQNYEAIESVIES